MAADSEQAGIRVARDDAAGRYEIFVDGDLAGFTEFTSDDDGRQVYPHTLIDAAYRGQGLAHRLIADAMTDAAVRGETVVPSCSSVAKYLRRNDVPGLAVEWPPEPVEE